jgi:YHS domain-containing protein
VNEEDPICGMKTAQFLKDTLTYNKKLYGFCGTHCKEAFKKEPKKYIKK